MKNKQILLVALLFSTLSSQASWFWGKDSIITKAVWYFTAPKLEKGIEGFVDDFQLLEMTPQKFDEKLAVLKAEKNRQVAVGDLEVAGSGNTRNDYPIESASRAAFLADVLVAAKRDMAEALQKAQSQQDDAAIRDSDTK